MGIRDLGIISIVVVHYVVLPDSILIAFQQGFSLLDVLILKGVRRF